jgi:hypothetical protein
MIHAEVMLEVTLLVIRMILGSDHPLVIGTESFMSRYNDNHLSIQHRLASHCMDHPEA